MSAAPTLREPAFNALSSFSPLHVAYVDTDLTRGFDVPKSSAPEIVERALDGLESSLDEVLADELTMQLKRGITASRPSYLPPLA